MDQGPPEDIDPIWMSSRTARQIYALGEVEKVWHSASCAQKNNHRDSPIWTQDITRLLSLAASSIALLSLPQTDGPEDADLPNGAERSEKFVDVANEYFERLDGIHIGIRSSLAHIRQSRIAPSTINAPPPGFIPPSLGVGLPSADADGVARGTRGLQEERMERDAWKGILNALARIKEARDKEKADAMES
ncbi:hypothetical protein BD309DRAFT_850203 [Dichomitus squalens]|uniref:Mediator complex subunit 11 n=1 Tax=Dichomitus squalens TaxID=114155 RepID=A0A4Q9Q477_9APHY|nr:uncharacterized protein DICSQDRAFT_164934 [Dichomitus squalens LYAD-421 SS1]EJF67099.1 hypothetical protein DICSQDRAFT_164934 [Dichomitus squalens LYAD-421 SS1]TBU34452.1 hypothetical protein BD311DRAFT_773542 [Dichomitus squalens]TBU50056.1 hypothetical protein BD309DRAFT_850203 [Dichomitus squalens]TBU62107.1 hypothetical protein BD310DRAFT_811921 [Dichomitus squalens]